MDAKRSKFKVPSLNWHSLQELQRFSLTIVVATQYSRHIQYWDKTFAHSENGIVMVLVMNNQE